MVRHGVEELVGPRVEDGSDGCCTLCWVRKAWNIRESHHVLLQCCTVARNICFI